MVLLEGVGTGVGEEGSSGEMGLRDGREFGSNRVRMVEVESPAPTNKRLAWAPGSYF